MLVARPAPPTRGVIMKSIPVLRGATEITHLFNTVTNHNGVICGGYVRYMCSPQLNPIPAGDIDIYFQNEEDHDLFIKKIKNAGMEIKHENEISTTFKRTNDPDIEFAYCPTIQVIKPKLEGAIVAVGTLEEILDNFDFTVVRVGLVTLEGALADDDFLEDELHKKLQIKNIHCPVSSTLRCMKYAKKGYFLHPFEVLKLLSDWENRDIEYRDNLAALLKESHEKGELDQKQIDELESLLWVD